MLDEVSLIHMNGRVYDPDLGRFLSPDPFIQQAANPQNFNRYSYVGNNPLSYTDPSGFFFKKLFKEVKRFVIGSIVGGPILGLINAATGIVNKALQNPVVGSIFQIAACGTGNIDLCAAAAGTVTAANGGSVGDIIKSAAIAAATAYAFEQVGTHFPGSVENIAAHGVVGGTFSEIQGGDFLSGFVSGAFGAFASNQLNTGNFTLDLVKSAVAGGIGAELGGGKFENGAVTGAFGYIYNYCQHNQCTSFGEQFAYDYLPGYKAGTCLYSLSNGRGCATWEIVDGVSIGAGAALVLY